MKTKSTHEKWIGFYNEIDTKWEVSNKGNIRKTDIYGHHENVDPFIFRGTAANNYTDKVLVAYGGIKKGIGRLVAQFFLNDGKPIEYGWVVHHKDFDPHNNCVENLQIMTAKEHREIHNRSGVISKALRRNWQTTDSPSRHQHVSLSIDDVKKNHYFTSIAEAEREMGFPNKGLAHARHCAMLKGNGDEFTYHGMKVKILGKLFWPTVTATNTKTGEIIEAQSQKQAAEIISSKGYNVTQGNISRALAYSPSHPYYISHVKGWTFRYKEGR